MPVKMDPSISSYLEGLDLTIWQAMHPKEPFFNEKTGKMSSRENKSRVNVALAGPGVPAECWGYGPTLSAAVDDALLSPLLLDRVTGIKGAMLRLRRELASLEFRVKWERLKLEDGFEGDDDDFIPF